MRHVVNEMSGISYHTSATTFKMPPLISFKPFRIIFSNMHCDSFSFTHSIHPSIFVPHCQPSVRVDLDITSSAISKWPPLYEIRVGGCYRNRDELLSDVYASILCSLKAVSDFLNVFCFVFILHKSILCYLETKDL